MKRSLEILCKLYPITTHHQVLVIAMVTSKTMKTMSSGDDDLVMPTVNPDPLSSNIYSVAERILLAWMNHNYEHFRVAIWKDCPKGTSIS